MRTLHTQLLALALASTLPTGVAHAQWSSDASANFALADDASDQNLAKVAPTPDGGAWVSWFDGIGSGWDVRIQKLDAAGNEVFAHDGLLVLDRALSSTQDYGLAVDGAGDALLAFRGQNGVAVIAAKVTAAGNLPWGAAGVVVSGSGLSPAVCATSDDGAAVAWTEGASTRVQKLDASGAPAWAVPTTLTPGAGSYFAADVQAAGTGAIVSIVHQTGGFSSPKLLLAQKLDGAGAAQWGATPVAVFDGGSLQFGSFPDFETDGAGGAVFSWYSASPSLQCFVQRVDAGGAELWPHNGVAVATNGTQLRVSPDLEFDAASGDCFVFWSELNAGQSQSGVSGQRIDAAGNLLWGASGVSVVPLSSSTSDMVRTIRGGAGGGALVVWDETPSFNTDQLFAAHVDAAGTIDVSATPVASTPSGKMRLAVGKSAAASGFAILAWSDARTDGGDIYVQNVQMNGVLGAASIGTGYCGPAALNSTGSPGVISATGSTLVADNDVTLTAASLPEGQFAYFLTSLTQGFTANPAGSQGDLCLGGTIGRFNALVGAVSGGQYSIVVDLSNIPQGAPVAALPGETWSFQCWYRDVNPGPTSNFTGGLAIDFL